MIRNCAHGVRYAVVGKDGVMECKNEAGFLYADEVCLMASSEYNMKVMMEQVKECVIEVGRRRWMMGDSCIGEVKEYKYLGVTVEGGKQCGFKSMGDRIKEAHGLIGMVKCAAERSWNKFGFGREGWKAMIVRTCIVSARMR